MDVLVCFGVQASTVVACQQLIEAANGTDRLLKIVGCNVSETLQSFVGTGQRGGAFLNPSFQVGVKPAHFRFGVNTVVNMLTEGIEAGEFTSTIHPRVAAEVLDAGLARLQEPTALRTVGVTFAEAVEEFMTLFTDGIRADA